MTGLCGHAWLGPLLGDAEAEALWSAEAQLAHMFAFEAAWSRALGAAGLIPEDRAEQVARAIEAARIDPEALGHDAARDGNPVPALVRMLRNVVGDKEAVHSGATSQDVLDTALALTLRAVSDLLETRITALTTALEELEARFGDAEIMGRTWMQAALPIRAEQRIATWRRPLADHGERLRSLRAGVERLQIGGPVGDRRGLGPDPAGFAAHVAEALDLADPGHAWHTERAGIADYAGWLSGLSGSLGKMGQDIALMSQQGVAEITLSGGGGSSAMPHKQNPVLAEVLVALARFNAGALSGVHHALVHAQERSGSAWMLEWLLLPQMCTATARSLSATHALIRRIERIGPT